VISLTGRHDRLDNYWYVLVHELAHVWKHLYSDGEPGRAIYDDLDAVSGEEIENEADEIALSVLVNNKVRACLNSITDPRELEELADKNKRSPAIYAGFLRKNRENYRIFNNQVGRRKVSEMFI
jgi:HTH-type transcriptional regulator/antitoxin HigA